MKKKVRCQGFRCFVHTLIGGVKFGCRRFLVTRVGIESVNLSDYSSVMSGSSGANVYIGLRGHQG
jgi:hypothetical protein